MYVAEHPIVSFALMTKTAFIGVAATGSLAISALGLLYYQLYTSSLVALVATPFAMVVGRTIGLQIHRLPVPPPLPPSLAGRALAFLLFVCNFGDVLGIAVGKLRSFLRLLSPLLDLPLYVDEQTLTSSFTQVQLAYELAKLPAEFITQLSRHVVGAYIAISQISAMSVFILPPSLPPYDIPLSLIPSPAAAIMIHLTTFTAPNQIPRSHTYNPQVRSPRSEVPNAVLLDLIPFGVVVLLLELCLR
ncbi:hypothetical protein HWV62_31969 [Athelia sp. TMB]|nr:hypothetical protein HWV62_31969 [Athelia sp. TMB]